MRFEISPSTPILSRRMRLGILSFVGLTAVIVFGLSVFSTRSGGNLRMTDSDRSSAIGSESPNEQRGAALAMQDDGPRGQSPDFNADDVAEDDRSLFKPRKQERSGDEKLFSRRSHPAGNNTGSRPDSGLVLEDPRLIDLKGVDKNPPRGPIQIPRRDRELPPNSPPLDDEWSAVTPPQRSRERDDFVDNFDQPLSIDNPSRSGIEQPGFDTEVPARPEKRFPKRRSDDIGSLDDNILGDRAPTGGRLKNSSPADDFGPVGDLGGLYDPNDYRDRGRDDSRPRVNDGPRDDIASPRIEKRYLDVVKDNTLGITREESDTFYWLLDHARRVSSAALERAGLTEVQYINLMTDPDRFRGEPITIEGDLWRLYELEANRNEYGVNRMYEGWVFTGDSGHHPYRVVCTSLPKGIEPGEHLRKPVKITGYFFKREGYSSNGGVHIAPTLLARRIGVNPLPNGIPLTAGVVPGIIGAMMAVGLAMLVSIVGFAISDERVSRTGRQQLRRTPHVSFANLIVPAAVPVEEALRYFAEQERESAVSGAYGPLLNRQTAREHAVHDYATSRQLVQDEGLRQQKQQRGAVQNWAARQKAAQTEIDSLRASQLREASIDRSHDDLNSDKLEPARHILPPLQRVEATVAPLSAIAHTTPYYAPSSISPPPFPHDPVIAKQTTILHPQPVMSPGHSVVITQVAVSDTSYAATKLAEWEQEVSRLTSRPNAQAFKSYMGATALERSAAAEIEEDRIAREQEIRERIQRQQAESERSRHEQQERERLEREREERDRRWREQQEQERRAREIAARERYDDSTTFTLSDNRSELDQREHELSERERLQREHLERERQEQERYDRERRKLESHSDHGSARDVSGPKDRFDHQHQSHSAPTHREYDLQFEDQIEGDEDDDQHQKDDSARDSSSRFSRREQSKGGQLPSSGRGRGRKHRRNWRDGESA